VSKQSKPETVWRYSGASLIRVISQPRTRHTYALSVFNPFLFCSFFFFAPSPLFCIDIGFHWGLVGGKKLKKNEIHRYSYAHKVHRPLRGRHHGVGHRSAPHPVSSKLLPRCFVPSKTAIDPLNMR
jgi:hypothetical protein